MELIITNTSNDPIYEQIYMQIKNHIISSSLKEGELLPSIRALAKDLRISVITTKRAYEELEKDGFIHTVAGKGCYVAPINLSLVREMHLKQIEGYIRKILEIAPACNLTENDIIHMLHMLQQEDL